MQGLRVSHRRVMLSARAWWCCGSRAERCHRAIEIGLLRSDAGAEIALRRRARHTHYSLHGTGSLRVLFVLLEASTAHHSPVTIA